MDYQSREIIKILRQHVHEICCHQYPGSDGNGNPLLVEVESEKCAAEPCAQINLHLGVKTRG